MTTSLKQHAHHGSSSCGRQLGLINRRHPKFLKIPARRVALQRDQLEAFDAAPPPELLGELVLAADWLVRRSGSLFLNRSTELNRAR
jgi:hypothetical protein